MIQSPAVISQRVATMTISAHIYYYTALIPSRMTIYLQILSIPTQEIMQGLDKNGIGITINTRYDGEKNVQQFLAALATIVNGNAVYSSELTNFRRDLNRLWKILSSHYSCPDQVVF